MPGYILHVGATIMCPHAGQVSEITANTRVKVSGQFVVTASDSFPIAGCSLASATPPSPCVLVNWIVPASRVSVSGQPVILQSSVGLCVNPAQTPQGPPVVVAYQMRAQGT